MMKRFGTFVVLTALVMLAAVPSYAATCSTTCPEGASISCSGDTCEATTNKVECKKTTSCGIGCTEQITETKTCGDGTTHPPKVRQE